MTPMSDVMVLLLTFFMLTATFVKEEPIQVQTPGSVSEIKIPEKNLLTIFVQSVAGAGAEGATGKVFMTMDSEPNLSALLDKMEENGALSGLTPEQKRAFAAAPTFGFPLNQMKTWLSPENDGKRSELLHLESAGIPCDSTNDELKVWVQAARDACGSDMRIAIKADATTPYAIIKKVMDSLRSIHENRYNLITNLKGADD